MKLISIHDVPQKGEERRFGHRPWGAFVMFAIVLAVPFIPLGLGDGYRDLFDGSLPWWLWLVAAPIAFLAFLIWLVVLNGLWRSATACFRRSNWVLKMTFEGVYLQFRSYLNHHFPDEGPTVVFLSWSDIAAVQKTINHTKEIDSEGDSRIVAKRYLDLHLKHSDTDELSRAINVEKTRRPAGEGRSKMRFHHAPVLVPEPGLIRVEWRGNRMLKALRSHLTVRPTRRTGEGYDVDSTRDDWDAHILKLIEEGQHMPAIRTVRRHYGMSLKQARAFVDDLAQGRSQSSDESPVPEKVGAET